MKSELLTSHFTYEGTETERREFDQGHTNK